MIIGYEPKSFNINAHHEGVILEFGRRPVMSISIETTLFFRYILNNVFEGHSPRLGQSENLGVIGWFF